MKWNMNNDQPEGLFLSLFPDGKKRIEGQYRDGKPDGIWTTWGNDGKEISRTEYKDGVPTNAAHQNRQQDSMLRALFRNAGRIPEPSVPSGQGDDYY